MVDGHLEGVISPETRQPSGRLLVAATCWQSRLLMPIDSLGGSQLVVNSHNTRDGTGSHFVTQRPSDPGIQRPGDPVDPVTLFYNELQMSTFGVKKYSQAEEFLIIIGKSKSSLHGLTSSDFSPTTDT